MAIAKKETLIALIESMDAAEKRFFTSHYQKRGGGEDDMFYRLFIHISAGGSPADEKIRQSLGVTDSGKMANLQRHLYGQLLESLRRQHRKRTRTIEVREQIDYASLLYSRGLYLQALQLLGKAKILAKSLHLDLHHLLIVEFEKMIESRHITRAETKRMESLLAESKERERIHRSTIQLSNLQLRLQRHFIIFGHVGNAAQAKSFKEKYHKSLVVAPDNAATFRERIGILRGRFWYHYNMLQLKEAANCAGDWVFEFKDRSIVREEDIGLYLKGLDRCLLLSFFRSSALEHQGQLAYLERVINGLPKNQQAQNTRLLGDFLLLRARLNQRLLNRSDQAKTVEEHAELAQAINHCTGVDRHKKQVLYYKLAALCVRAGLHSEAIDYLNLVLNDNKPLRADLRVYSRLLFLFCQHFLGNKDLVGYGINNLARYLGRIDYPSIYPRLSLQLLRDLRRGLPNAEARNAFTSELMIEDFATYSLREVRYLNVLEIIDLNS